MERHPWCFGYSERVCPRDEKGFIQPRQDCLECEFVKACLQKALKATGVLPTPILETPAVSRFTRFLKRWSDQKLACGKPDSTGETK
jgi:hypothetical protein